MNKNYIWTAKVITLFPEMFPGALSYSLVGKAMRNKLWNLETYNLRDFAIDKRKRVDGPPAGGGAGQILKPNVLHNAISFVEKNSTSMTILVFMRSSNLESTLAKKQSAALRRVSRLFFFKLS